MNPKIKKMVGVSIFTAIVVVLQLFVRIPMGAFSLCPSLIPIVIGAAVYGWQYGAWLGFACGVAVLLSGDAAPFWAVNVFGTILTVLAKGALCGLSSGLVYHFLQKTNKDVAAIAAAIVCPIVNTGVFMIGCLVFFMGTVTEWATMYGYPNAGNYMIFGLAGLNFIAELTSNILLAPMVTRLIRMGLKK